jgi:hypothetical protein
MIPTDVPIHVEIVVCKDLMGNQLERVIWEDTEAPILIYIEGQFSAHKAGSPHLEPFGFPVQDVFKKEGKIGKLVPYALSRQT